MDRLQRRAVPARVNGALRIGARVVAQFEQVTPDVTLLSWAVA